MKHYKSVEFVNLKMSSPPHKHKAHLQKRKAPLLKTFWRWFCVLVRL